MATRSYIGVQNSDGTIAAVYCHFDGYLDGVGATLREHWNDEKKVRSLLTFGSMSCLGSELGEKHDFNARSSTPETWCTFYCRDRGEDLSIMRFDTRDAYLHAGEEFNYLFVPGEGWLVDDHGHGFENLEMVFEQLAKEAADEDAAIAAEEAAVAE